MHFKINKLICVFVILLSVCELAHGDANVDCPGSEVLSRIEYDSDARCVEVPKSPYLHIALPTSQTANL